jgi:hypothetical protein
MSVARQYNTTVDVSGTTERRLVVADPATAGAPTISLHVLLLGIVAVLVGAWGAIAPFVGPDFGFVADRATAWQWSETSALLALLPGAVAFICGLLVVGAATRPRYGRRPDLWLLGLVVALSGAWFVIGQYIWRVIDGRTFVLPANPHHFMWKELCFAVGPGVVLVACGALFMGWSVRRSLAVVAEHYPRAVHRSVTAVGPAQGPVAPVATTAPVTTATPSGAMAPPQTGAVATEPVVAQRPVVERPVDEEPVVVERPVAERSVAETPVVERRVAETPVVERPAETAVLPTTDLPPAAPPA